MQLDAVAFGAHPDDIELFCGGTLIKLGSQGRKIGVISLTKGELGTRGSPKSVARSSKRRQPSSKSSLTRCSIFPTEMLPSIGKTS